MTIFRFIVFLVAHLKILPSTSGFGVLSTCFGSQKRSSSYNTISSQLGLWNKLDEVMDVMIDQTLFPYATQKTTEVDPREELALFDLETLSTKPTKAQSSAYASLTNYLQLWARQLELQPDKGLATPIVASDFCNATLPIDAKTSEEERKDSEMNDEDGMIRHESMMMIGLPPTVSMTLKFRPPKRYLSYKEQKNMEKGTLPDRKGAKVDAWSPGVIELIVFVETTGSGHDNEKDESKSCQLKLLAKRCDIDGDTVIKYSSERAIVRRLKEAIRIWKKVRSMP